MKSVDNLNLLSDGRIYGYNDRVKAETNGCKGCSACCHHIGHDVSLTPFDIYELRLSGAFESLDEVIHFIDENKIAIPYLKVVGQDEACVFLNDEERCSIHKYRPSICRLFPLGRIYETDDIQYFLQEGACVKPKLDKVKVKKWINIKAYPNHKAHILQWYQFQKALAFRLKFVRDEEELKAINAQIWSALFTIETDKIESFYDIYNERLNLLKKSLGVL